MATERRITSPLIEPSSIEKVFEIDAHVGCAVSGLTADARMLVEHARVEAQQHHFVYNERMKTESITQAISDLSLKFGENDDQEETLISRPFGVALLIAGVDENGPQLFYADPSGTYGQYFAKAMGAGSEVAQNQLHEEYKKDMSLKEAEVLAIKVLKQVMEDKIHSTNTQLASVTVGDGFKIYEESEVHQILASV